MEKFFAQAQSNSRKAGNDSTSSEKKATEGSQTVGQSPATDDSSEPKRLPKGVVLGKDGKP